jgi:hypothetical protein
MDVSETEDSLIGELEGARGREQGGGGRQEQIGDRHPAQDPGVERDDHPDQS